jgi:hypothetical protein
VRVSTRCWVVHKFRSGLWLSRNRYVKFCSLAWRRTTKLLLAALLVCSLFFCLYVQHAEERPRFVPLTGDGSDADVEDGGDGPKVCVCVCVQLQLAW